MGEFFKTKPAFRTKKTREHLVVTANLCIFLIRLIVMACQREKIS